MGSASKKKPNFTQLDLKSDIIKNDIVCFDIIIYLYHPSFFLLLV